MAEQFAGVNDLCCFAVDDSHYGQNVGLALVMGDASPASLKELHGWLRRHLGEHQMPVQWFLLESLPRTSRGKINRDQIADACRAQAPVDLRRVLG